MNLHIPYFDDLEYYQFIWKYDRLNKYKTEKKSQKTSITDFING
jgi:hypothetical protein